MKPISLANKKSFLDFSNQSRKFFQFNIPSIFNKSKNWTQMRLSHIFAQSSWSIKFIFLTTPSSFPFYFPLHLEMLSYRWFCLQLKCLFIDNIFVLHYRKCFLLEWKIQLTIKFCWKFIMLNTSIILSRNLINYWLDLFIDTASLLIYCSIFITKIHTLKLIWK